MTGPRHKEKRCERPRSVPFQLLDDRHPGVSRPPVPAVGAAGGGDHPYSEFEQHLKEGRIEELAITDRRIEGRLKEPLAGGQRRFITNRVEPQLAEHLQQYPVRYTGKVESTLVRDLLSWIVPAMLFFGIWLFLLKRIGSGLGAAA